MRSQKLEKIRQEIIPLFYSSEGIKSLTVKFKVDHRSIRSWWVACFGRQAVRARGKAMNVASNQSRGRPINDFKICPRCRNTKPIDQFNKRAKSRDGHREWCAICEATYNKQHRKNLSPEARAEQLEYKKKYHTVYSVVNFEKLQEYARVYRKDHREACNAKNRKYYTDNPEKLLLHNARARSKRWNLSFDITEEDIHQCIPTNGCCPITLDPFERGKGKVGPRSMTLDRIVPELGYVQGNIAIISHMANTMKQNCIDPDIFERLAFFVESPVRFIVTSNAKIRPAGWMIKSARNRARNGDFPCSITKRDLEQSIPSDGHCPITLEPFEIGKGKVGPRSMSLDRINPNLGYVPGNIMVISHLANTIKQNCTDPNVFRRLAAFLRTSIRPVINRSA